MDRRAILLAAIELRGPKTGAARSRLARRLGWSTTTLTEYVRGERHVSDWALRQILWKIGLSFEWRPPGDASR